MGHKPQKQRPPTPAPVQLAAFGGDDGAFNMPGLFQDLYKRRLKPSQAVEMVRDQLQQLGLPRDTLGEEPEQEDALRDRMVSDNELDPEHACEENLGTSPEMSPDEVGGIGNIQDGRGIEIGADKAAQLAKFWDGTAIAPEGASWNAVGMKPDTYTFQIFVDGAAGEPTNNILGKLLADYGPDATLWAYESESRVILSPFSTDQGSAVKKVATHETGWPWRVTR